MCASGGRRRVSVCVEAVVSEAWELMVSAGQFGTDGFN